jgi:hypothetical protein
MMRVLFARLLFCFTSIGFNIGCFLQSCHQYTSVPISSFSASNSAVVDIEIHDVS